MPNPAAVRLFHITAIANLPAICTAGGLMSKNAAASAGIAYQNIAYQGAQGARSTKQVPNPPGGTVHDYVPLYFAPRSPMLMAINSGKVPGCDLRQGDIVHLETTVQRVVAGARPLVFYDRNATLTFSVPYIDLARLDAIAWDLLTEHPTLDGFCKYWHSVVSVERYVDRMERRQAEFLVKEYVELNRFTRVGVIDASRAAEVQGILTASGVALPAVIKRDWYFLGQ